MLALLAGSTAIHPPQIGEIPAPPPGRLVLVVGRDPLRTSGGSESYSVAHAHAAIIAGYEPHMFSAGPRSEVLETEFGFLHRVATPVRPPRGITCVLQRPFIVPPICRFLSDNPGPHVVHSFGVWADSGMVVSRRLARRGVEALPVATVYTASEHEAIAKLADVVVARSRWWWAVHRLELAWVRSVTCRVEAHAFRRQAVVLVNYANVARLLEDRYGSSLPLRQITYSPPTAHRDPLPSQPPPDPIRRLKDPDAPLIVSVSRHDGRKGLDLLIEALAMLRDQGCGFRACLVGPGLLLGAHRRLVTSLGLDERVAVPGRVPEVTPYLTNCDVYVLPSREEGSGSVAVLEAMQAGACILAAGVDGLPEDLTHEHDALLVEPSDPRALAEALRRVLEDEGLRARLAAQARATYGLRFAAPVTARALSELYTELGLPPSRAPAIPDSASTPAT